MIRMNLTIPVGTTTAENFYHPVPCRGIVKAVRAVYTQETDADETVDIQRDTTSVNLVTPPANATAEGVVITGVPDTTNKDLIFDPASSTAAYKRLKIVVPNTFDSGGHLALSIDYDESAAVLQTAALA